MVDIDKAVRKSSHNRQFFVFTSFLCLFVFLISMCLLIRPAQSMIDNTECGMTEHIHTDECYTACNEPERKFLACEYQNYDNMIIHIHDSFCYDDENILICPLEEITHEHESSCYNDNGELTCNAIVHQHDEDCFKLSGGEDYRILACGIEEHSHSENCKKNVMICPSEETTHEDYFGMSDVEDYTIPTYETQTDCHTTEICDELVMNLPPPDEENENETISIDDSASPFSIIYQAVSVNYAGNPEPVDTTNALNLVDENKLTSVVLNYQSADGIWHTITDPTQGSYPPDKPYRFRFKYEDIDIEKLISEYDYKLIIPDCIPHWFNVQQECLIMYESQPVGKIKVIDGNSERNYKSIVIAFNKDDNPDKDSLKDLLNHNNLILDGNFYILGNVLLNQIDPKTNQGSLSVPNMNGEYIQFVSGNLPEKYGKLDIIKREMGVESDDTGDYIKYKLVLQSLSSDADIPDVTVEDTFTGDTKKFVEEYAGIPVNQLSDEASGKNPYEVIEYNDGTPCTDAEHGSISYDSTSKTMTWNVGELKAGTTRELIYYVKTDKYYMGSISRGELVNNVKVFSNKTLKDEADAVFIPQASVSVNKKKVKFEFYDDYGNGYLNYEIKITGNKKNSYDLVNLRLHDYLVLRDIAGTDIHNAKSTMNFDHIILATSSKNRNVDITPMEDKDLTNAAFDFKIDKLSPGETITITYSVKAENLYVYLNGYCELSNHAEVFSENEPKRGNASNYMFASSYIKNTFTEYQWMRKLPGIDMNEDIPVDIPENDTVFAYQGTEIEEKTIDERTFIAPNGSKKYTVDLNEQGLWDLSSTNLKDEFSSGQNYISYKGYLEIQQHDLTINSTMNSETLLKTVWLDIDGRTSFSFTPEMLNLVEYKKDKEGKITIDRTKCYAYRLVYYAVPVTTGVGQVMIANEFYASGNIGVGGIPVHLLGLRVCVSGIVQGSVQYKTGKDVWYFDYNDGKEGSIYWVLRLDGTIPAGLTLEDSATVHRPSASTVAGMNEYRIKGVYKCSSDTDPLSYDTYDKFESENVSAENTLTGNSTHIQNCDALFSQLVDYNKENNTDFDYVYGYHDYKSSDGNNSKKLGITFQKDIELNDNDCIYIIVNTVARFSLKNGGETSDLPNRTDSAKIFDNTLGVREKEADSFVPASEKSTATYIERYAHTALKEGVVAYMRDGDNWSLISTSDNDQKDNKKLYNKDYWHKEHIDSKGIYAEWILNINWDGSLEGTADLYDVLPKGMEPVYIDCNGELAQTSKPEFYTVPELDISNEWKKINFYHHNDAKVKLKNTDGDILNSEDEGYYSGVNSPVYYNPETNTIRLRVGQLKASQYVKKERVGFVLICKITKPEMLLTDSNLKRESAGNETTAGNYESGGTYFENEMEVICENGVHAKDKSYIKIDTRGSIIKSFAQENPDDTVVRDKEKTDAYSSDSIYQQFKIVLNPLEYDLSTDSTGMFPPLIDKIDRNLTFLTEDEDETIGMDSVTHKGGVEIKYADGTSVEGYIFRFNKEENEITINNLPANKKIIITYWTKINASDLKGIPIKNTAYWLGYANENDDTLAQVDVIYNYDAGGTIICKEFPTIKITKVDSDNFNKKLEGAEFELYEAGTDRLIKSGITDADGKIVFTASTNVTYDKLYYIKEKTAPEGYELDNAPHYFIIRKYNSTVSEDDLELCEISRDKIDICYTDNIYYTTLSNDKQEANKIRVTKHFKNLNGESYAGEYRFGIYSSSGLQLQILSIVYDENGKECYKLNNIPVDKPEFTCAEPDMAYYIYELDDKNKPVYEGKYLTVNGSAYCVSYASPSNVAAISSKYNNFEVTNEMIAASMPETGGTGLKNYYMYAFSGFAFVLLAFALFRKIKSDL